MNRSERTMKWHALKMAGFIVLVAASSYGYLRFRQYREREMKTAIIDSFEPGTAYKIKFHNAITNYEATCNTNHDKPCMRFSAGEKHPFGTFGGTVVFFDTHEAQAYKETKESTR